MSVIATCISTDHSFTKTPLPSITLIAGLGVQGDCHSGKTVQHRSRMHIKPAPPNLRQVHLIHSEFFEEVAGNYNVMPGNIGENITTKGIDLLTLSTGTKLRFVVASSRERNEHPVVRITGVRNPCPQIDRFQKGLKERCVLRDGAGAIVCRKAGIMGVVEVGGEVPVGASIVVEAPATFKALEVV